MLFATKRPVLRTDEYVSPFLTMPGNRESHPEVYRRWAQNLYVGTGIGTVVGAATFIGLRRFSDASRTGAALLALTSPAGAAHTAWNTGFNVTQKSEKSPVITNKSPYIHP
jgi:hypothetical protein